jgi:predicted DsbA family dithiol-disulfide isomerase
VLAEWMQERFGAEITWMPFDLHPEYPPEGLPRPPSTGRMEKVFEENGLVYNPPPVRPNSMRALRLAELARERDLFDAMHARLMDAYWAEAQDIGDPEVLRALAAEAGLEDVDDALAGDAYRDVVARSTENAHGIGITGIPAFLLDRKLLILGAYPKETFEQAFTQLGDSDNASEPNL